MGMTTNQPLTLTVEQAAEVLGVGRSTAYELVRSGDLKSIRLRRRIVVPVAHLAESLGVDRDAVWDAVGAEVAAPFNPSRLALSKPGRSIRRPRSAAETQTLF
jgi:excisionase family DNA binding protein